MISRDFVSKWRQESVREHSGYQEHFRDVCALIGHPTPTDDDPTSAHCVFDVGASTQPSGQRWANVWKRGVFAWEYKGGYANLDEAYLHLLMYRESLQNPPLLVVSDMATIQIYTNVADTVKQVVTLELDDLLAPVGLQQLRDLFTNPEVFRAAQTTEQVTELAAVEFARLATLLRRHGAEPQHTARFLTRVLFCLFAEDVGLLPAGLFARLIADARTNASLLVTQFNQLFAAMRTGGVFATEKIAHFNGRLFDDVEVLAMNSEGLDILQRASALDWSSIEPTILGTLFERSFNPAKRTQLGAPYTSRADVMLIIEPVLMAPLRRRWDDVQSRARTLAVRRNAANAANAHQAARLQKELTRLLTGFAAEIAGTQVLDPACGGANFLYVALRQLLDLEKAVITLAQDLAVGTFVPSVSPKQLHGIEINAYAHELAQITIWIGYIQWLHDNGFGVPNQPILKPLDTTITHVDAFLAYDAAGTPVEQPWPKADVIVGTPPFFGGNKIHKGLGDSQIDAAIAFYAGRMPARTDIVCHWFDRVRMLIERGEVQRAGLLATHAIRHGENRKALDRITQSGDIFMAWADRTWILDGTAVRVSIIGFDSGKEKVRELDGQIVTVINADLTGILDFSIAKTLSENNHIYFRGDEKGGPFDIDEETAADMLRAPENSSGRLNTDVVRPYVNGFDITRRPHGQWMIDFGATMSEEEASLYESPFEYVRRVVRPIREHVRDKHERTWWWLHKHPVPELRNAISGLRRFIATPVVAKHRLFMWFQGDVIPDHHLYVFARDDDYFFGVLHSKVHELWALAMSTQIDDRPRYSSMPARTFETFPFPWTPGAEPVENPQVQAIAAAARHLVDVRDNWLNAHDVDETRVRKRTITGLYTTRPTWLVNAHAKLDAAVYAAYGWEAGLTDTEILARLLALNLGRG